MSGPVFVDTNVLVYWQDTSDLAKQSRTRSWIAHLGHRRLVRTRDALIVAAAQSCGCSVLLTEDLQHGQRLGDVRVIDPFRSPERTPAGVLEAMER